MSEERSLEDRVYNLEGTVYHAWHPLAAASKELYKRELQGARDNLASGYIDGEYYSGSLTETQRARVLELLDHYLEIANRPR